MQYGLVDHATRLRAVSRVAIFVAVVALALHYGVAFVHASPPRAEAAVTRTYSSARPGPALPDHGCLDNAGVTQSVLVPDSFLLGAVRVGINLTHPWRGDVFVSLSSPDSSTINILNLADEFANYNVLIDDASTNAAGMGAGAGTHDPNAAAWQYTWRSAAGLGLFKGTPTAGTWTLTVCDRYWGDRGQLNYWNLYLDEDRSDYAGMVVTASPTGAAFTGSTLTYNIVVPNNTGRTGAVMLVAPLPAGVAYVAGSGWTSPANGTVAASGGQVTWTGTPAANQTITVTYQAVVRAQNGWLTNTVTLSDPLSVAPVIRRLAMPVAAPQYRMSQIAVTPAAATLVNAGQVLAYSVNITNSGQTAGDASLINPIPAGVTYVTGSARTSDGGAVAFSDETIRWSGSVAAGARVSISYQARVDDLSELAQLNNIITNKATINDPLAQGATTISAANPVAAPAYTLSTIKTAPDGGYILPGQPVTYVIGLYNSGALGGNVTINAPLPAVASTAPGGATTTSGAAPTLSSAGLRWSGALAAGQRITFTYELIVNAVNGQYSNTVNILDSQIGAPTVKTAVNPIATPQFDASTLTPNKVAVAVGERFTYTLVIRNSGRANGAATSAVVALPVGLQSVGTSLATAGSAQWGITSTGLPQLTWNGSILSGGSVTIQIPVIASTLCGSQIALIAALTDAATAPAITTLIAPVVQTYYNLIFNEDFSRIPLGPPPGWSIYRAGGNCDFAFANWYNHTGGSGGYFYANSFTCGEAASMDTELRTPVFSLAGVAAPVLQFRYDYYRGRAWGQVAAVDISTAGSAGPWTNVWKLSTDDRGPKLARIDLKAYAGQTNLMLRFHYAAPYWAYWWQVDDVLLYQVCPVSIGPEALREGTACRGRSVTYTLSVANMTAVVDTISITTTSTGAGATINPATVQLNAGASGSVNVVISVPWGMGSGSSVDTILTAQGTTSGQTGQVILRTTAGNCSGWTTLAPVPGPAGDGGLAYLNGALYQFGGRADGAYLPTSAVYRYTISTNTWQAMAPIPVAVAGIDAAAVGDAIYVAGGEINAQSSAQTTLVQVYRPATNAWGGVAPLPIPLAYYEAHALNGRLYVIGGFSGGTVTNTLFIYDPASNAWTRGAPLGQARMFAAAGVIGGKLYVAGGYDGVRGLDSLEIFTPNADGSGSWTAGPAMLHAKDSSASGVLGDRYLVVAGGWQAGQVTDGVTAYDAYTGAWITLPNASSLRVGARAEGDGSRLFAVGGYEVSKGASTTSARNDAMAICPACTTADRPQGPLSFTQSPVTPRGGEIVTFYPSIGDSTLVDLSWDFGDGVFSGGSSAQTAAGRIITHTYTTGGLYRVTVTATNGCGSIAYSATVQAAQYGVVVNPATLSRQVQTTGATDGRAVADASTFAPAITYTLRVTNTGSLTDRITIAAINSDAWSTTVTPASIAGLAAGRGSDVTVVVNVPANAIGAVNVTTLTATSAGDPLSSGSSTLMTWLNIYQNYFPVLLR